MKLTFTGDKVLEELKESKDAAAESSDKDAKKGIFSTRSRLVTGAWNLNQLFKDRFKVPLAGLEIVLEMSSEKGKIWVPAGYPEVSLKTLEDYNQQYELNIVFQDTEKIAFDAASNYLYWTDIGAMLRQHVESYVKQSPAKQKEYEAILGKVKEAVSKKDPKDTLRRLDQVFSSFLIPEGYYLGLGGYPSSEPLLRILKSGKKLYVENPGHFISTRVDDQRVGVLKSGNSNHLFLVDIADLFKYGYAMVAVEDEIIFRRGRSNKNSRDPRVPLKELLNKGAAEAKDGSEIILNYEQSSKYQNSFRLVAD